MKTLDGYRINVNLEGFKPLYLECLVKLSLACYIGNIGCIFISSLTIK